MYGDSFNIACIEPCSHIYGPGLRFVVWVQGCSLCCLGCWNQGMWPTKPNTIIHRNDLLKKIEHQKGLTGVTILGGEPLEQAENTLWLLREAQKSGLDTMLYTGYEMEEINACPIKSRALMHADILVSGRYDEKRRNIFLKWRGSENQTIQCLSPRYTAQDFQDQNDVEIHIDPDGSLTVMGYPTPGLIKSLNT